MSGPAFDQFFRTGFGKADEAGFKPYAYQCRLACGEPPEAAGGDMDDPNESTRQWLSRPDPAGCRSQLISIPTGLGKTAAVVLAWLWNFLQKSGTGVAPVSVGAHAAPESVGTGVPPVNLWPRRLVYCLPMRTLVEQTRDEVARWLGRLAAEYSHVAAPEDEELAWLAKNSPFVLMGGEENDPAKTLLRAADQRASASITSTTVEDASDAAGVREAESRYGARRPVPWSHQWHDALSLESHRLMAERIRARPALLEIALPLVGCTPEPLIS